MHSHHQQFKKTKDCLNLKYFSHPLLVLKWCDHEVAIRVKEKNLFLELVEYFFLVILNLIYKYVFEWLNNAHLSFNLENCAMKKENDIDMTKIESV